VSAQGIRNATNTGRLAISTRCSPARSLLNRFVMHHTRLQAAPRFGSILIAFSLMTLPFAADARLASPTHAHVSFTAIGPGGMQIVGTSDDLTVGDDASNIKVSVPLSKVTTGIGLRDRHMHEKYLEVAKFPNAELSVSRAALHVPTAGQSSDGDVPGTMTMHGQSKTVTIHYSAKRDGNVLHIVGSAPLNMNAFGIETPSYMGVKVKPDVSVSVAFDASDVP
jgi:polyisoprenoid-binding protein YceI